VTRADVRVVTAMCALWLLVAGVVWGTHSVSGADSYGYVSEAALLLGGTLVVEQPLARSVPWPNADWTLTPLGYRPGLPAGTQVPVYPVGLPLLMALAQGAAGPRAVFLVVPLLAAVCVVATASMAARLGGRIGAVFAALLLAASPTMLFAALWPMSDVPAAAWWALSWAFLVVGSGVGSAVAAGTSAALAVLTTPNLVGLTLPAVAYLVSCVWETGPRRRTAFVRLACYAALAATGCVLVAVLHTWLYGSPLQTGYGDPRDFYAVALASQTLPGFLTRPIAVEPMLTGLGLAGAALAVAGGRVKPRGIAWLALGSTVVVVASYTFYLPNAEWWYVRLLLPAYPLMAVLGGAAAAWLAERLTGIRRVVILGALAYAIVMAGVAGLTARGILETWIAESRYERVARFVADALPPNAILLASQHSGSLRYYAERPIVRFDLMDPAWLDRALAWLHARGYRPYIVVEDWEMAGFRRRFRDATPLAELDWPPVAVFGGPVVVRVFDPSERRTAPAGSSRYTGPPHESGDRRVLGAPGGARGGPIPPLQSRARRAARIPPGLDVGLRARILPLGHEHPAPVDPRDGRLPPHSDRVPAHRMDRGAPVPRDGADDSGGSSAEHPLLPGIGALSLSSAPAARR
jgi:hypothetical protein